MGKFESESDWRLRDIPGHGFRILFGAVTWPNEQDIASETLLAGLVPVESSADLAAINVDVAVGYAHAQTAAAHTRHR